MGTDHPPRKQGRLGEPSLWVDEPTDDALSLLEENALRGDEPALWGDERTDDVHSLLEENARLRKLAIKLSNLLGDLPRRAWERNCARARAGFERPRRDGR